MPRIDPGVQTSLLISNSLSRRKWEFASTPPMVSGRNMNIQKLSASAWRGQLRSVTSPARNLTSLLSFHLVSPHLLSTRGGAGDGCESDDYASPGEATACVPGEDSVGLVGAV